MIQPPPCVKTRVKYIFSGIVVATIPMIAIHTGFHYLGKCICNTVIPGFWVTDTTKGSNSRLNDQILIFM